MKTNSNAVVGFTKGPWRTGDMFNRVFGPPNGNPAPEIIATVHKGNKANANLLAAAPELLEALYMALPYVETALEDQGYKPGAVDRMVKQIHGAISKATGLAEGGK